jgi:putative oxidoreductase
VKRLLGHFSEVAFAAMRVVVAFNFLGHGLQKLTGALGGHRFPITSQLGLAGLIETVLGALILVGLFTSVAAFVASGEMAFAFFLSHYPSGGWPVQNGGELAVGYCFVFLFIATRGGGRLSLDALFGRGGS